MKTLILSAALAALPMVLTTAPAWAQAATAKPGNCAVYAEMAADTVKRDARTKGAERATVVQSLMTYSAAQSAIADAQMAQTYEQSKAFGWDKAKVDQMMAETEKALRAGFHTSTMDTDKLYMDHVVAINNCALSAKTAAELGQSPDAMRATLQQMQAWAQS